MKDKKGFTLIELLTVIVIMGILMMVAIPSMTKHIENSKKDAFVATVKEYTKSASELFISGDFNCTYNGDNAAYNGKTYSSDSVPKAHWYISICTYKSDTHGCYSNYKALVDSGGKSPWGNKDLLGFIIVDNSGNSAYFDGDYGTEDRYTYQVRFSDGVHAIRGKGNKDTISYNKLSRNDVYNSGDKFVRPYNPCIVK